MRMPDSFKVGSVQFQVLVSPEPMTHPEFPGKKFYGGMLPEESIVVVWDDKKNPSNTEESFVHEAMEAINFVYDLGLPHQTIKTIGVAMHQIFKENGRTMFGCSVPVGNA